MENNLREYRNKVKSNTNIAPTNGQALSFHVSFSLSFSLVVSTWPLFGQPTKRVSLPASNNPSHTDLGTGLHKPKVLAQNLQNVLQTIFGKPTLQRAFETSYLHRFQLCKTNNHIPDSKTLLPHIISFLDVNMSFSLILVHAKPIYMVLLSRTRIPANNHRIRYTVRILQLPCEQIVPKSANYKIAHSILL